MAHSEEIQAKFRNRLRGALAAGFVALACACIHRHGGKQGTGMVAFTSDDKLMIRGDCKSLGNGCAALKPTEADVYASERYDAYRTSGFVTLKPHMQLRIVAPIMRPGSSPIGPKPEANVAAEGDSITVKAGAGLMGYQTAVYSVREGEDSGSVEIERSAITVQPIGKHSDADLVHTDYLRSIQKSAFLRLYFQLRHAPASHRQVMLVADSQGELNEASGEFEPVPDEYCAAEHPHARCIEFPQFTAVNAEIRVFVKKKPIYVPLSATVKDAMIAAGMTGPAAKVSKLKIKRYWDGRFVPVAFDPEKTPILSLTVSGDDRITF
jgi:hypothetical protein